MTLILSGISLFLLGTTTFLAYAYYKLGMKVLELEEQVESSLDVLDACYSKISEATNTPVASDDPIVLGVVSDVKQCKEAVLLIANKLVTFSE